MIIGIDPGLDGAVASITNAGRYHLLWDAPTIVVEKSGGKSKREYNLAMMKEIISLARDDKTPANFCHAALEVGSPRPGEGTVSAYSIGRSVALWEAFLVAQGVPYTKCYPHVWKKKMMNGMSTSDKGAAVLRAIQIFPEASKFLARKKDHGRAEALLLAKYILQFS